MPVGGLCRERGSSRRAVDDEGRGITLHARVVVRHPSMREAICLGRLRVICPLLFLFLVHPVAAEQEAERDAENVEDTFIRECADEECAHGMLDRTPPSSPCSCSGSPAK
jgi:hypothetical protein